MTAAGAGAAVSVAGLAVVDFRSYARLRIALDPGPVVLTGPNGAGKTNLLEAVSFLSPGRGLRGVQPAEGTRRGAPGWTMLATVGRADDRREIVTGLAPGETRRTVRIDGRSAASQGSLAAIAPMLWLTPAMDRLFQEGASGRRRFLDRLVLAVHPDHGAAVALYERAMRERSRLLAGPEPDPAWLSALEDRMATAATAVAAARRETVLRLAAAPPIEGFPPSVVTVEGRLESALADRPAIDVEEVFRRDLCDNRRVDAATGTTVAGPHRSDLLVRHGAKDMPASHCSTGEQKALLIGIVMAQARLLAGEAGAVPILLLDEVAAHLDGERRAALYDGVLALGAQAWMTGTDAALFAPLAGRARRLRVEDGAVHDE